MTAKNKKLKALAGRLTELSRSDDGSVEESRVRSVLTELVGAIPPQTLRKVLKFYYAAIARELRFSEAKIEYAGSMTAKTAKDLAAYFAKLYARTITPVTEETPELLGGLKVQVGDDVYDASLAGILNKLRLSLSA